MKTHRIPMSNALDSAINSFQPGDNKVMATLRTIRTGIIVNHPLHGNALARYTLIEDASVETITISGLELRFNPEAVVVMSPDVVATLMINAIPQADLELVSKAMGIPL